MEVKLRQIVNSLSALRKLTTAKIKAKGIRYQFVLLEKTLAPFLQTYDEGRSELYNENGLTANREGDLVFSDDVSDADKQARIKVIAKAINDMLDVSIEVNIGKFTWTQIDQTGVELTPMDYSVLDWIIAEPTKAELGAMDEPRE